MNKKILILNATEHLLAKNGFEHLSMQMVAKKAGVATGTIYRYFDDKNDLLTQLRSHVVEQCAKKVLNKFDDTKSMKHQFTTLWKNTWQLTINRDDNAINREQFDSLPSQTSNEQKEKEKEYFLPVHQFFLKGINNGSFKALSTDVLASIGIEPAICLGRKQINGLITLDSSTLNEVIDACWDAISLNHKSEQMK